MAVRGRKPLAQTALLIVAPLLVLLYAGVFGWLWWADQQDPVAHGANNAAPQAEQTAKDGQGTAAEGDSPPDDDGHGSADAHGSSDAHGKTDGHGETAAKSDGGHGGDSDRAHAGSDGHAETDAHGTKDTHAPSGEHSTADTHGITAGHTPSHGDETPHDPMQGSGSATAHPPAHEPAQKPAAEPARRPAPQPVPDLAPRPQIPVVADQQDRTPLKPAPDPELLDQGRYGPLPKRGPDGRVAWRVYGRPFTRDAGDRLIAIVISELGLSETPTLSAIQDLPGEITLAFSPYSKRLGEWVPAARAAGHEVLLQVPMEPRNTDLRDPGDKALMTTNSPEVNLDRLGWVLSRATGYVGVTSFMGSRMTVSERDMRPVLNALADRGLVYADPKVTPVSIAGKLAVDLGVPAVTSDRLIDQQAARDPIDRRLAQLEQIALTQGSAVGFAQAYPVTIERLRVWIPEMKKRGFELAPITAVVATE